MSAPLVVHTFRLQVSVVDMLREHTNCLQRFYILFRTLRLIVHIDLPRITAPVVPYLSLVHFSFHFYVYIRTSRVIVQVDLLGITAPVAPFLGLVYLYLHLYVGVQ